MNEIISLIKYIFNLKKIIIIYFLLFFLASILYTLYKHSINNTYNAKLVFYDYTNLNTTIENDLNKFLRNININFNLNYIPQGNNFDLNTSYQRFRDDLKESALITFNNNIKNIEFANKFINVLEKNFNKEKIRIIKSKFINNDATKDTFTIKLRLNIENQLSPELFQQLVDRLNQETKFYIDNFYIFIEDLYNEELEFFKFNVLKNLYDFILVEQQDIYLDEIDHLRTELVKTQTMDIDDYTYSITPCRGGVYCINYVMGQEYISKILELHIDKKTHFYINSDSFLAIGILEKDILNFDKVIENLNTNIKRSKIKFASQEYFKLDEYDRLDYLDLYLNYIIIISVFGSIFMVIMHIIFNAFRNN